MLFLVFSGAMHCRKKHNTIQYSEFSLAILE